MTSGPGGLDLRYRPSFRNVKAGPVSGTSALPGNETVNFPDQLGEACLPRRKKVALPEKGVGGTTVALSRSGVAEKLDAGAGLCTNLVIEVVPTFSLKSAAKRARGLRPSSTSAPNDKPSLPLK
jgi:hypothetical protein